MNRGEQSIVDASKILFLKLKYTFGWSTNLCLHQYCNLFEFLAFKADKRIAFAF